MDARVKKKFMSLIEKMTKAFGKSIAINTNLSNHNWFNLGGPADFFFKPENKTQLIHFLEENKKNKLNITILGAGSNVLIRDNGIRGVVIKLGKSFSGLKLIEPNIIEVGASSLDRKIAKFAMENGIGNLEFLSCIPGSIGGAIIMNSGCYGNDISKVLISIMVIDIDKCIEREILKKDIKFFYRGTNLPGKYIITSVKLKGKIEDIDIIQKRQDEMIKRKKLSQPSQIKTCGSTFKNLSDDKKAWSLIKESGCDNFEVGNAKISKKHCNFFVNNGGAKSADIESLIKKVRRTVKAKTGVNLELEIKILGD